MLPENPQSSPRQEGFISASLAWIKNTTKAAIEALNRPDPEEALIENALTPELLGKFKQAYDQMLEEGRSRKSFKQFAMTSGPAYSTAIFEAVFKDVVPKELKNLRQPYETQLVRRLRDHCGLTNFRYPYE